VVVDGVVAWTNPQQEHPVHSLPPGFGVAFRSLSEDARGRIEQIVFDYLARQSGA
jgi:Tfp pilus assembly protein PilZ